MVSQPQAPDPYTTAAAQTQSNEDTAKYQQSLNQTNQITPYGSINYQQTGTSPDGAPISTATTTLSQPVENLVNSNIANSQGNSNLESALQGSAGQTISAGAPTTPTLQNLDLGNSALLNNINQKNEASLDPQWAKLGEQNAQNTYDQGLAPGSQGYEQNQNDFNNARNSAYNSMFVADQGQAAQDLTAQNSSQNQNAQAGFTNSLAGYNNSLNALSALQSGSQISQPGVGQTAQSPQTSVAGTNISGLIEQNYQQQLQQSNATMGGLFGLGGTALQAAGMFL